MNLLNHPFKHRLTGILIVAAMLSTSLGLWSCHKVERGVTPTVPPVTLPPAKTEGFITMNLTGNANGTALNESLTLRQYYSLDDVSVRVDSSEVPAARIVSLFRIDTASGSRMQLIFRIRNVTDTGSLSRGRSATLQFYKPNADSARVRITGGVPNTNLSDLQLNVVNLNIRADSILDRISGRYAMAPNVNGASGVLVTGSFDISLRERGILVWR